MAKLASGTSEFKEGVFITKGKITDVEVGQKFEDNDFAFNLTVTSETKDGNEYEKTIFINGKLWKNSTIPLNWSNLLYACGINDVKGELQEKIVDDFSKGILTEELKEFFIGKEIKYLNYVSGTYEDKDGVEKPSYKIWNGNGEGFNYPNTWDVNTPNEDIIAAFEAKLDGNYPPNYTPEVLEELEGNSGSKASNDDDDDDLI
jgi:hypothetical protein